MAQAKTERLKNLEESLNDLLEKKNQQEGLLAKAEEFVKFGKSDNFIRIFEEHKAADNNFAEGQTAEEHRAWSKEFLESCQKYLDMLECQKEYLEELIENEKQGKGESTFPVIPPTTHPKTFITPKDLVSNLLFIGKLREELLPKAEEGNGKKELTAKVNINFDGLENILIGKDLSPYDREVHDSVVSLYVDGGNEYVTPQMIYRTMTGNPKAKLNPKQQKSISESVARCSFTMVKIDATDEAKAYNMDKVIYEGNLLYTEKITGKHKGEIGEWIRILRKPVLYDYASSKNQVGRLDLKLLDTPVNKSEEITVLQGYLQRRILSMHGTSVSRNIVYETVYKYLNITAETSGAARKKKSKIRDFIKVILTYWKEQGFILGFNENSTKSLSIEIK